MSRPTLYLSGPMTGLPHHNRPAFERAARALRLVGYNVFSPAENGLSLDAEWSAHMRQDIRIMVQFCGAVATLPGWENSKGAKLEAHIARELGWTILPVDQWEDVEQAESLR